MKERPILIAVIGYIIGILWGLYFNFSVAFLYIFIAAIYFILKMIGTTNMITSEYDNVLFGAKSYEERLYLHNRYSKE